MAGIESFKPPDVSNFLSSPTESEMSHGGSNLKNKKSGNNLLDDSGDTFDNFSSDSYDSNDSKEFDQMKPFHDVQDYVKSLKKEPSAAQLKASVESRLQKWGMADDLDEPSDLHSSCSSTDDRLERWGVVNVEPQPHDDQEGSSRIGLYTHCATCIQCQENRFSI